MKGVTTCRMIVIWLITAFLCEAALAQPSPIPSRRVDYFLDSGTHDGLAGRYAKSTAVFHGVVRAPETSSGEAAPWLRLHFQDYDLGDGSYLVITSLEDGARQLLDARSLGEWQGSSAYFNGDAVEVDLYVAPRDEDVYFAIGGITAGEHGGDEPRDLSTKFICGTTDERVASNDPAVGRILGAGCTGWIASNGVHLTASHCFEAINPATTLQFNVPPSDANGAIRHPPPEDQYAIVPGSVVRAIPWRFGDDWAMFECAPNSNTGLLPVQAQQAFYRMSRDSAPANIRITGYGVDGPSPCFGEHRICTPNPRNGDSQTQQTDVGAFAGESGSGSSVVVRFQASVTSGNSGGPVIVEGESFLSMGIQTNAGCSPTGGSNSGTSFENDDLEDAAQSFPGADFVYVDAGHPTAIENGTVLRPFDTVAEGAEAVPSGGTVSIVAGTYDEGLVLADPMTLVAPVGTVTIR